MKTLLFFFSYLIFYFGFLIGLSAEEIKIDPFVQNSGAFPVSWKTYPFQMSKAKKVYRISEENAERFIRAEDSQDISMPIFKDFDWSLQKYPLLSWKWRARTLPKNAHEDGYEANDSACSVYVVFERWRGVALKYVWSTTLPAGHVWEKEKNKFNIIVKESGAQHLNQWKEEVLDVVAEYKKYFGKEPTQNPLGIAILTEGNATHSPAACDYSGFKVLDKK